MCRLFGFRSKVPARVHRSLVDERNSLRVQSRQHQDGWGVAYYDNRHGLSVAHGLRPAHQDPEFERVSRLLSSHAVVAHIRAGTIGPVDVRNTHPFLFGSWTFAHNGTLRQFGAHQMEIESWIAPHFRARLQGETDSERCFYLFLTHLEKMDGLDNPSVETVAQALAATAHRVFTATERSPSLGQPPSATNFLATDGRVMVAARRNRSLFVSEQSLSVTPGTRHPGPVDGDRLRQCVIASERLCGEDHWHEVPENSLVGVDENLTFRQWTLSELLR